MRKPNTSKRKVDPFVERRGRPSASLGRFARTLFGVLAQQIDELGPSLPDLGSERALTRWCYDLMRGNLETAYDRRFQRAVRSMREAGLFTIRGKRIILTPAARVSWREYQLESIRITRPSRWDGIWRIVIWDVPEERKTARNALRALLRRLGFAAIQQSVWVVPWPCRGEVTFIREQFSLGPSLLYLESSVIDGEQHLRDYFNL